ncbi:MAG: hypothetical protein HY864_09160 [Chloroflexi bacterium]|nr:hypothetical protein [Chloroflexota bacterium]
MKLISKFATALILIALMVSILPAATVLPVQAATCYWAQFVSDVTIPDGTNFAPGAAFVKTWRLKNIGTCAWSDVSLIFDSGQQMGAPASSALPTTVNPGQTVDITVNMTAPSAAGHYFGYYKFKSTAGGVFGIGSSANSTFWVEINVNSTSGTGYDFTAKAADATWSTGAGAFTFPGTDGNANGFALKLDKPKFESGVESALAGLLFAPNAVDNGYVQGIYPAFNVQSGDRFQATIGCEYGATTCYVTYRLDYQIGTDPVKTFWTFREKYEGWTYNVNLSLSTFAGKDVKFILVNSAYGSPTGDRGLWVNPVISRSGGTVATNTPAPTVTGTPPTATPSKTPTAVSSCTNLAQFISDVTVADGTTFAPNAPFLKTWRLKNIGTCTWTNYSLIFDTGEKMGGLEPALIPATVAPGQTVDISINLTAPAVAGTYRGYWKLKTASGTPFGIGTGGTKSFWVEIKVSGTAVTPGPSPTPGATATPITGTRYDFAANVCAATWYSGAGALPCPGTDGDAKGFVLITNPSRLENGTNDNRTGLITFPQNINNGYIQGFYPAIAVQSGDKFRSIVNCENGATSCFLVFRLDYSIEGSSTITNFWAFSEKYEGQYYSADIDLSALAGKNIKFILTVLATGSATGDRALWVGPIIYNAGSVAPTTTSTTTATATVTSTATATSTATSTPTATATP